MLLVERHALLAEALEGALATEGVGVRRAPASHEEVVAAADDYDVVLVGVDGAGPGDALDLLTPLRAAGARVVVLGDRADRPVVTGDGPAVGVVPRTGGFDEVLAGLRRAMVGDTAA